MLFTKEPFNAVNIKVKGLRKENGHIAFPESLYCLMKILLIIPQSIINVVSNWLHKKNRSHYYDSEIN